MPLNVTANGEKKDERHAPSDTHLSSLFSQVFEEEHHILYLDHGGVIVAIKDTSIPLKILKYARLASSLLSPIWSVHLALMFIGVT